MTLKVMGKKVFINSAGFIRVCGSGEAASETQDLNPLDDTRIHPESYQVSFSLLFTHAIQCAYILMQSKSQDTFLDQVYFTIRNGLVSNPFGFGRSQSKLRKYINTYRDIQRQICTLHIL